LALAVLSNVIYGTLLNGSDWLSIQPGVLAARLDIISPECAPKSIAWSPTATHFGTPSDKVVRAGILAMLVILTILAILARWYSRRMVGGSLLIVERCDKVVQ
jgi:hypothetical protein